MIAVSQSFENIFCIDSLMEAWKSVAAKNAAPGMDNVSVKGFARSNSSRIKEIHSQIISETYNPDPLLVFNVEKNDSSGLRELSIPTVKDKIVARTAADYENYLVSQILLPQSYAYRKGRGALKAVSAMERTLASDKFTHVARIDIADFFDTIDHNIMRNKLFKVANSDKMISLLMKFAANPRFDGVSLNTPEKGIPQGSPLAPVMSNIYLDTFDKKMNESGIPFIRYADDIAVFASESNSALERMNIARSFLGELKLAISVNKTRIQSRNEGILFLGFIFQREGKMPCREAGERLAEKLSEPKFDDETHEQFLKRRESIVRGWNNYFHFDKKNAEIKSDSEKEKSHKAPVKNFSLLPSEKSFDNEKQEINIDRLKEEIQKFVDTERSCQATIKIRNFLIDNPDISPKDKTALYDQLSELYRSRGLAGASHACYSVNHKSKKNNIKKKDDLTYDSEDVKVWLDLFASDSVVYRQFVDKLGRHGYKPASKSLNPKYLLDHWTGRHTLSVPLFDKNNNVRFAVMDLDISRKKLDTLKKEEVQNLKTQILDDARGILETAFNAGVHGVIEDSGYKGYHVWFFFYDRLSAELVKNFLHTLNRVAGNPPSGTHRELFPASAKLHHDEIASRIKIPLGYHKLSGQYSQFITPDGKISEKAISLIRADVFRNRAGSLKKAIHEWNEFQNLKKNDCLSAETNIEHLFKSCAVLNALRSKAQKSQNLTHYERVVLRAVLSPLGQEGRKAIHAVMKNCQNYKKSTTDKMLSNDTRNPMGCRRIKEILGYLTYKLECNCRFRKSKNKYDNPLRHLTEKSATQIKKKQNNRQNKNNHPDSVNHFKQNEDTSLQISEKNDKQIIKNQNKKSKYFELKIQIGKINLKMAIYKKL